MQLKYNTLFYVDVWIGWEDDEEQEVYFTAREFQEGISWLKKDDDDEGWQSWIQFREIQLFFLSLIIICHTMTFNWEKCWETNKSSWIMKKTMINIVCFIYTDAWDIKWNSGWNIEDDWAVKALCLMWLLLDLRMRLQWHLERTRTRINFFLWTWEWLTVWSQRDTKISKIARTLLTNCSSLVSLVCCFRGKGEKSFVGLSLFEVDNTSHEWSLRLCLHERHESKRSRENYPSLRQQRDCLWKCKLWWYQWEKRGRVIKKERLSFLCSFFFALLLLRSLVWILCKTPLSSLHSISNLRFNQNEAESKENLLFSDS